MLSLYIIAVQTNTAVVGNNGYSIVLSNIFSIFFVLVLMKALEKMDKISLVYEYGMRAVGQIIFSPHHDIMPSGPRQSLSHTSPQAREHPRFLISEPLVSAVHALR